MKLPTSLILTVSIAALLSGCNSIKVKTDYVRGYNFRDIKSFTWIDAPTEITDKPDTHLNPEIPKAIEQELAFKGIEQVKDSAKADVLLSYYLKVKDEQGYTNTADHGEEREFSGGIVLGENKLQYKEREPDLNMYTWQTGTLVLTMKDAKTKTQIWQGKAKVELDRSKSEEEQNELIRKVAEKLMNKYPPII